MSCNSLPNAAKPVWAKQLSRLPSLAEYVTFQLKIGSQLLLSSTRSNVLPGGGSGKAFIECLWVINVFPSVAVVQLRLQIMFKSDLS